MTELSPKERVLAKYPGADAMYCDACICWHIYGTDALSTGTLLPYGDTPDQAWASALRNMEKKG